MMDPQLILNNYQGKWLYLGDATHGFDEAQLSIDDDGLLLVKKLRGKVLSRASVEGAGHVVDDCLLFDKTGQPAICIRFADDDVILFGEQKDVRAGTVEVPMKANRVTGF